MFYDTAADKRYSRKIELARPQYSGNAHGVIRCVGIVTCVYVNPDTDQFLVIDCRIYDPDNDGKTKLYHVKDMLLNCLHKNQLSFRAVLMDSWHTAKEIMLTIEQFGKIYFFHVKSNRQTDDSGGLQKCRRVDSLEWAEAETQHGKLIKIKGFPKNHKVKLLLVAHSTKRTDYVVTNDIEKDTTQAVRGGVQLSMEGREVSSGNQTACWLGMMPMP